MSDNEKHVHETFTLNYPTHDESSGTKTQNQLKPVVRAESDNSGNKGEANEGNN